MAHSTATTPYNLNASWYFVPREDLTITGSVEVGNGAIRYTLVRYTHKQQRTPNN